MKTTLTLVSAGWLVVAAAAFQGIIAGQARAEDAAIYENSADGLKKLITDVMAAVKADDKTKSENFFKAMALPNPDKWFAEVFGDEVGKKLAEEYNKNSPTMVEALTKMFAQVVQKEQTEITVLKIEKADDENATGLQKDAISAMKKPVALYTVKMVKKGEKLGMSFWSLAYVDNGFRVLGKLRAIGQSK